MKKWLAEHKLFTVISAIVIVLCAIVIASYCIGGSTTVVGRLLQAGVAKIEKPISYFTDKVSKNVSGYFDVQTLLAENEELKKENEELKEQNKALTLNKAELTELEKLSKSFKFEPFKGSGKAVAGKIIELDNSNPYVVFTIDVGTEAGIKKGNPVVDGNGLVGKVQEAGEGYSKVVSILSTKNKISFKLLRNTSVNGILEGGTSTALSGYVLDSDARVIEGDEIITSGIGDFPEGITIGTIASVKFNEDEQLKTITVEPATNFKAMQKVAVYYEY